MDTCFVSNYSSSNRQNCRMTMSLMTCMCLNHINFRKIRGKTMNIYFESKSKRKSILNARVALHHPSLRFPLGVLAWAVCCIYRYKSHHPWGSGHGCSIGHIGSSQHSCSVLWTHQSTSGKTEETPPPSRAPDTDRARWRRARRTASTSSSPSSSPHSASSSSSAARYCF